SRPQKSTYRWHGTSLSPSGSRSQTAPGLTSVSTGSTSPSHEEQTGTPKSPSTPESGSSTTVKHLVDLHMEQYAALAEAEMRCVIHLTEVLESKISDTHENYSDNPDKK